MSIILRNLISPRVLLSTNSIRAYPRIQLKRDIVSESAAYDGDGKTTVKVINEEERLNFINTYSNGGFRLSNNLFIHGSILLYPTHVFSWNVRKGADITPQSLIAFDLILPKVKIVIIGYGSKGENYDPAIAHHLKKRGISCEILETPRAVTTYNYLASDAIHVAGAFIPVRESVQTTDDDDRAIYLHHLVYKSENSPSGPLEDERDQTTYEKNLLNKLMDKKKKFD